MAKKIEQKNTEVTETVKNSGKFIVAPRITEKASVQSNANAYTFVVTKEATKLNLSKEIQDTYKVKPVAINITNLPGKAVFVRGKFGRTAPVKKAIVFLKKGDSINIAN
jgi:large subunit ribosomal protein L23